MNTRSDFPHIPADASEITEDVRIHGIQRSRWFQKGNTIYSSKISIWNNTPVSEFIQFIAK